jgi:peptide/nickel transport system substrate-binding protein
VSPPAAPLDAVAPASQGSGGVKRITAAIRGLPAAMSQRHTQRSVASVAGLDALEELVHAGLTHADVPGVRVARLAEAVPSIENGLWRVFPDGRMETTWRIKPAARWHDGTPLTAEDLLFATTVEQDRETGIPRNPVYELIERVEAQGPSTISIVWKRPYIEADAMFGHDVGLPMPKHLLQAVYADDRASLVAAPFWSQEYVGAGPYTMRAWIVDSHVVLQAYDQYVLGRPKIDEIEVRFIPDPNTVVANLLAGAVDLTLGRGPSFEQGLQLHQRWQEGTVIFQPGGWIVITPQFLNANPPIVTDLRFRRALMHAADRQEMADSLMAGQSSVAHTFVSPDQPEYPAVGRSIVRYEYDPRKASQMIEGLGYARAPDGFFSEVAAGQKLSVEISTTVQNDTHLKAMPAAADYWKQVGVAVDQVPIPLQRIQDREYRATFPAFTLGLVPMTLGSTDMRRFHSGSAALPENRFTVTGNTARYRNQDMDVLVERYVTTIPRAERLQVLAGIVSHQTDQVVAMGLFHYVNPTMAANRLLHVTGRGPRSQEAWNAHEWDVRL